MLILDNIKNVNKNIKAVMFDMDGTLIDTEKYYKSYWIDAMKEYGYNMTYDQYLDVRELGHPFIDKYLHDNFGDITFDEVGYRVIGMLNDKIEKDGVELMSGVIETMQFLKEKNIKIVLVTSSHPERAEKILKMIDIYKYFTKVVGAFCVEKMKPAPDVFLYACKEVGVMPQETIMVEDAPNGVIGAYEAGCNVVMVPEAKVKRDEMVYDKTIAVLDSLQEFEVFYKKYFI